MKIRPLRDKILIHNLERGYRTLSSGIVLLSDDGKEHGVRPRWAEVYAVGPDVDYLEKGQWVLMEHGRWTRGIDMGDDLTIYAADKDAILVVSDKEPKDGMVGNTTDHGFTKVLV